MINDTNYTVAISKLIIENASIPNNSSSIESIVPFISLFLSIIISALTFYFTNKNLETQLKHDEKNIYIQIYQQEIVNSINKLIDTVGTGVKKDILTFLDSRDAIYIPPGTKKKIRNYLKKVNVKILNEEKVKEIVDLIYIY